MTQNLDIPKSDLEIVTTDIIKLKKGQCNARIVSILHERIETVHFAPLVYQVKLEIFNCISS